MIDREECFSHQVQYEGNTVHVSFVVIKADSPWHYGDDGVDLVRPPYDKSYYHVSPLRGLIVKLEWGRIDLCPRGGVVAIKPVVKFTPTPTVCRNVSQKSLLLEVKDLTAVIAETKQEILKDVNFVVYEGEVHTIMGKNGSGKSTFAKGNKEKSSDVGVAAATIVG
ncbi:ABC transporter I family member 6 [Cucumis melo var. makuwa]|uniref:ABC transporter I family member 6 n=1 Tax=Cucumis melo var. makuwa TaxID=1194695 RepID=A0A5A7TW66_CUCMM|nr:ABC transporter I family member 6 [Cucumis melo var. makuwa]TYK14945.1 ABC transporter I family member 6 [Cucumis melo var. makuwa]